MSDHITRAHSPRRTPRFFRDDEEVEEGNPNGPHFGDAVWDFGYGPRVAQGERRIHVSEVPDGYFETARHLLFVLSRPLHPVVVESGIVFRRKPAPMTQLVGVFSKLKALSEWGGIRGLRSWREWTESDFDDFLADLKTGRHRQEGRALEPSTVRGYVSVIKLLYHYSDILPDGLETEPWPMRSSSRVAGEVPVFENRTPPLQWDTWRPMIAASAVFIDRYSVDILAADRALRAAHTSNQLSRGARGTDALDCLETFLDNGGRIPLHTGFGKAGGRPRGTVNFALLVRLAGVSGTILKRTHPAYQPRAYSIIDRAVSAGKVAFGGLVTPTVKVSENPGETATWITEIGMGEAEYLPSLLRAAGYILIASLTGMRDSEIQELKTTSMEVQDGLSVLRAKQFKGRAAEGADRTWWAPEVLARVIPVLGELAHHEQLFARVPRSGEKRQAGAYMPHRDVARLIDFVNAEPSSRVGRGSDLALEKIPYSAEDAINATTLRRSFSVYSATYPNAIVGIGIQLGHAVLRETTQYGSDGSQRAVSLLNEERVKVVRQEVDRIVRDGRSLAGAGGEDLAEIRAQIVLDPNRAQRLVDRAAEQYHLGIVNDCLYRPNTAACGTDGPHLAGHFCAADLCTNAVFHETHRPLITAQIERIDRVLDRSTGHAEFIASIREQRARWTAVLHSINDSPERTADAKESE